MASHRDRSRGSWGAILWSTIGLAGLALVCGGVFFRLAWGASTTGGVHPPAATAPAARPLVFDGVTVVDVATGQLLPNQRVVIVGTHIRAVGSAGSVRVPAGARVVPAHGKYLIPGLWDMHTHSRRYTDFFYPLFIANGVTGIRDAWSEVPLDTQLLWRRQILAGTRVGPPRQILVGDALDEQTPCQRGGGGWWEGHLCVIDEDDARHVVDSLKAAGATMIKTYDLRDQAMYFAIAAEARRIGIPFGGHLEWKYLKMPAIVASDSGARILDHTNSAGDLDDLCLGIHASVERCQLVAEHFQRNGTWWVPTLVTDATMNGIDGALAGRASIARPAFGPASKVILTRFFQFARAYWASPSDSNADSDSDSNLDTIARSTPASNIGTSTDSGGSLRIVHRVGLPILAGTDSWAPTMERQPPGFSLHTELALYVAEGLTPLEALRSATLNPATAFHLTDSLGTVAPGKLADLVLLDADPLQDISNTTTIRAVVANGWYFDRAALDELLADVRAKANREPRPLGKARLKNVH